jgi:hypothetical protein
MNGRRVTFPSIHCKIYSRIIIVRIKIAVDTKIRHEQAGVREENNL